MNIDLQDLRYITNGLSIVLVVAIVLTVGMWITWMVKSKDKKINKITKIGGIISACVLVISFGSLMYVKSDTAINKAAKISGQEQAEVEELIGHDIDTDTYGY